MRKAVFHFGFIAFILCCPLLLNAEEVRTWQDDTGLFSIEATLQQIVGNSVQLRRADDGRVITLPINRLSEADQRHIAGLAAQNPFEGGVPAAPRQPSGVNMQQPAARQLATQQLTAQQPSVAFPSFADLEVRAVEITRTRVAGGTVPNVWTAEPDPTPTLEQAENVVQLAFCLDDMPAIGAGTTRNAGFFIDPSGSKAVIAYHVEFIQRGTLARDRDTSENFTRIFLGNTVSGDVIFHDTPLKLQPLGFSADGTRFAFSQDDWVFGARGQKTLLYIVEVAPSGWTAVAVFEPFAQLRRAESNVRANIPNRVNVPRVNPIGSAEADIFSGTWVDDRHLLVQSDGNVLILLNVNTGEAIWRMRIERRGDVALSPGGKYFFLPVDDRAILMETLTGSPIGNLDGRNLRFRFSPNGKRFATITGQGIMLGDTATGALETPFFVRGSVGGQQVHWLDDRFLMLGSNGSVVDTSSKAVVWTYIGLQNNVKFAGGHSWCFFDRMRQGAFLAPLTLPHAAMVVAQDAPVEGETQLALRSGVNVSLLLDDSIAEDRADIREVMEQRIADNGWVLADVAPITITLSMTVEEETDTAAYGVSRGLPIPVPHPMPMFGGGGGRIEVTFQPERYDLKITDRESSREIWSATLTTRPPQQLPLNVVQDDSLQEVIDRAMEAHSYKDWIEKVFIPRTISRPQERRGESRVTENGIVDVARR